GSVNFAVVFQVGVRNLDDQTDVRRSRNVRSVIVCLWCQESNVRLGLAVSKLDRVLNTDDGLGAKQAVKQSVETFDTRGVLLPDGQFGNNLPTDEFDPVILIH